MATDPHPHYIGRMARDFGDPPTRIANFVGGTTSRGPGPSPRLQGHDRKARMTCTNPLDWTIAPREMGSVCPRADKSPRVTASAAASDSPTTTTTRCARRGQGRRKDAGQHQQHEGARAPPHGANPHDAGGEDTGVAYLDARGTLRMQCARTVCLTDSTFQSLHLVLNVASSMFPDGPATSSGQVGSRTCAASPGRSTTSATSRCGCGAAPRCPASSTRRTRP